MKYRKKPIIVEAEQWFPGKEVAGVQHFPQTGGISETWYVKTIHGQRAYLAPGDWVIQESDGIHYYPCKPEEFERIYEVVEESGESS